MAEPTQPVLTVVIPTHNRAARVIETLGGIASQTLAPAQFEVIVVNDASTDDTALRIERQSWPFACRHMPAEGRGAAAARNTGARHARGTRLYFLDDDITLGPGALAAALDPAHEESDGRVLIGHSEPVLDTGSLFGRQVARWWHERFREMAEPGHRFGYSDVFSGNMAIDRTLFAAIGGFDDGLRCREDYELGIRLVAAGAGIAYAPAMRGLHFDASTPERNLTRARAEGTADLLIGRKHPEFFPYLKAANMTAPTLGARLLRSLVFTSPVAGRLTIRGGGMLGAVCGWLGLQRAQTSLSGKTRALAYQQGVAAAAGDRGTLFQMRDSAPPFAFRTLAVDALDDPADLIAKVAETRPDALQIMVGTRQVGGDWAAPGRSRLDAPQARRLLAGTVWHWAPAREAGAILPPLPGDDPDWLARAATGLATVALGEVDCADWRLSMRTAEPTFPLRLLLRRRGKPAGWVHLPEKPAPGRFWRDVRAAILGDPVCAASLLRTARLPTSARPAGPAPISVVVCTRDRTDLLRRCLGALSALDHPDHEIVIVDNAPTTEATRLLVAENPGLVYVREDRPGLDWARNAGARAARHDIIAYTDDDTMADAGWLSALACAFDEPSVGFVTGLVVPMKLDTDARLYFEDIYGGMGKGFAPVMRDPAELSAHDLLWASALGVGANMAFRRSVLERAGWFDPALDVGTATRGGGDIEMFHRALSRGAVHLYEPAAFVWHEHRADFPGLRRQLADNGSGFASYLLAAWRNRTVPRMSIVRFALRAWLFDWQIRRLINPGRHNRDFVRAEIGGLMSAPRLWRKARRHADELARSATEPAMDSAIDGVP